MKREIAAMAVVLFLVWALLAFWAYQGSPSGCLGSFVILSAVSGPIWIPLALFCYERYLKKNWDHK